MAEQQRRRSFDEVLNDALKQWTVRFERALEEQRQVIGREAQERSSEIERATLEHLEALGHVTAEKTAEIHDGAAEHVRRAVAEGATGFEEFAQKRLGELEDTLRAKLEGFRRELVDETHRVRDATADQLTETRSLVTSEARRLEEQATATQDEMRRVAADEAVAFDKLARERVAELQDALRSQTELLGEFTRMHESTSDQLDDVRAFTTEIMARLSKLDVAVARQIQTNEESVAASAAGLKQASAKELNSIQQRAIAFDQLAREHIAEVERAARELLDAETSTAEGLREFERHWESRRTEIETLVDGRIDALAQRVRQAEAAVVRRITELGERTVNNAQALDTRLAQATDRQTKELDALAESVTQALDARLAQAAEKPSLVRAMEARVTKLAEMIAAAQAALDQVAGRVETLEERASAPVDRTDAGAVDGIARRGPKPDARNSPDLRGDR